MTYSEGYSIWACCFGCGKSSLQITKPTKVEARTELIAKGWKFYMERPCPDIDGPDAGSVPRAVCPRCLSEKYNYQWPNWAISSRFPDNEEN